MSHHFFKQPNRDGPGVAGRNVRPGAGGRRVRHEESHRYCREDLGARSTVIPINRRNQGRKWPKARYRRQMVRHFRKRPKGSRHRRVYGKRRQAGSAFSRPKRLLGSALRAKTDASRQRECYLRVLTHDWMLLAASA